MHVPFETLAPTSRIWIYQSDREFSDAESQQASDLLRLFTESWTAHGSPLKASFDIRHNRFIILAADEAYQATSGCSIDESVHAIQAVEKELGMVLFDRNQVAFLLPTGVISVPVSALRQNYAEGIWNQQTVAFNNLITQKDQLESEWVVPAGRTWLKRYIPGLKLAT